MQVHYPSKTGITLRKGKRLPKVTGPLLQPPPEQVNDFISPPRMLWKLLWGEEFIVINGAAFSLMLLPGCKRENGYLLVGGYSRFLIHKYNAAMLSAIEDEGRVEVTTYGLTALSADSP